MTEQFEFAGIQFEWDKENAKANVSKHGVSFEEAIFTFLDLSQQVVPDPLHSLDESRLVAMGWSGRSVLMVVHVERGSTIRIISARKATAQERSEYERNAYG